MMSINNSSNGVLLHISRERNSTQLALHAFFNVGAIGHGPITENLILLYPKMTQFPFRHYQFKLPNKTSKNPNQRSRIRLPRTVSPDSVNRHFFRSEFSPISPSANQIHSSIRRPEPSKK